MPKCKFIMNGKQQFEMVTKIIFGYNFVTTLMKIKVRLKMKNRSQIYDINRPRPRHGHKYTKCKVYLTIMFAICIK